MAYRVTKDDPMHSSSIDLTVDEFDDLLSMCDDGVTYQNDRDRPQANKYLRIQERLTTLRDYIPGGQSQ